MNVRYYIDYVVFMFANVSNMLFFQMSNASFNASIDEIYVLF